MVKNKIKNLGKILLRIFTIIVKGIIGISIGTIGFNSLIISAKYWNLISASAGWSAILYLVISIALILAFSIITVLFGSYIDSTYTKWRGRRK